MLDHATSETGEVPANAGFDIESSVHPPSLHDGAASPREPLRYEGPFGDHTGYDTLLEPHPVLLRSPILASETTC